MGFEQLAALRDQLAAERIAREGKQGDKPAANKNAKGDGKRPQGEGAKGVAEARQGGGREGSQPPAGDRKPQRRPHPRQRPPHVQGDAARPPQNRPARQIKPQPETPRDPLLVAIGRLQHAFPKAFPKKPDPRVALKLGIVEDLYAHAAKLRLSEDDIKAAVATWCSVGRYWAALTKDAVRVGLDGEPSGTVTAAEAGHANFLARQQRKKAQAAAKAASTTAEASHTVTDTAAAPGASHATATDAAALAGTPAPGQDATPGERVAQVEQAEVDPSNSEADPPNNDVVPPDPTAPAL